MVIKYTIKQAKLQRQDLVEVKDKSEWHEMSPYGSTNDHRQRTELERTSAPDPVGDGATEEAPNKSSSQADTHHEPCAQQRQHEQLN